MTHQSLRFTLFPAREPNTSPKKMKFLVSRQVAKLYCFELDVLFIPLYINESKG